MCCLCTVYMYMYTVYSNLKKKQKSGFNHFPIKRKRGGRGGDLFVNVSDRVLVVRNWPSSRISSGTHQQLNIRKKDKGND